MTTLNKASLQSIFAQGDVPQGTDFAALINSQVNLAETLLQSMAGPLQTTKLAAPLVSAAAMNITGTFMPANLSTGIVSAVSINLTGNISSNGTLTVSAASVSGIVSAASLNVTGDVRAAGGQVISSAATIQNGIFQGVGIVSAVGTDQATGAPLTFIMNRLQGVVDSQSTGFAIPANKTGLTQYIVNETAVSANLWPPTGGKINGGSANTIFVIAGNTSYTIIHVAASAYGVK